MNKQELVHLHSLLHEVKVDIENRNEIDELETELPTSAYADVNVEPNAIHKSQRDQEEAVTALLDDLTTAMDSFGLPRQDQAQVQQAAQKVPFTDYSG